MKNQMIEVPWVKAEQPYDNRGRFVTPEGDYTADIRSDGCVDLTRHLNGPLNQDPYDCDTIHICDLDELIIRLTGLAAIRRQLQDDGFIY